MAVLAAVGLLVSAGFAFNEIFLYWFPNFGFAFLLLGILVAVQFFGPAAAAWSQMGCMAVAAAGLAVLAIAGLGGPEAGAATPSTDPMSHEFLPLLPRFLLLFIGFELAWINASGPGARRMPSDRTVVWVLLSVAALFGLWGWVSLQHAGGGRLADSTISHLIAARAVMGQTGRLVMGAVIVAGAAGTLNALFTAVERLSVGMAETRWLPAWTVTAEGRAPVVVLAAGAAAAVCMALGLAGSPILEPLLRAALGFWLLLYGCIQISGIRREKGRRGIARNGFAVPAAVVSVAAALALAAAEDRPAVPLFFCGGMISAGAAWLLLRRICRRQGKRSHPSDQRRYS
jgi:amino acid transporter